MRRADRTGQTLDRERYRLSSRSWDAKFATGDHYATDRPLAGLVDVLAEFERRSPRRLVDVGCGDGRNLPALAELARTVCGIDLAPEGLRRARERLSVAGSTTGLVRADIGGLPFRVRSLDGAVCVWTMNHGTHDEIQKYVAELWRVLRPGGLLFASVTAWGPIVAVGMVLFGRRIADASLDGHSYLLRFRSEEGVHHFFTRREVEAYFGQWRVLRLCPARYRAEAPVRLPFWDVLAQKPENS